MSNELILSFDRIRDERDELLRIVRYALRNQDELFKPGMQKTGWVILARNASEMIARAEILEAQGGKNEIR